MSQHVILDSTIHRDLRVRTEAGGDLGDAVMGCPAMPDEFRRIQSYYPIVFRRDLATGSFSALALFGFESGENLFLDGDKWDAPYRPLAQAVQPFLIGRVQHGGETPQMHLDTASPRVGDGSQGTRLFDEDGQPTPYLEDVVARLGALDAGYRSSGDFFAALERHDLLEPFTLEVPLEDGSKHSLVGFHIIDEARLAALDAAALGELQAAGHLMPLFMAVASLGQFTPLVARKNARLRDG